MSCHTKQSCWQAITLVKMTCGPGIEPITHIFLVGFIQVMSAGIYIPSVTKNFKTSNLNFVYFDVTENRKSNPNFD
uniref:Uncharacterized protein n=1 Tax=Pararge aegeria TaxID=116150 RepID=S4PY55_9NEOP